MCVSIRVRDRELIYCVSTMRERHTTRQRVRERERENRQRE